MDHLKQGKMAGLDIDGVELISSAARCRVAHWSATLASRLEGIGAARNDRRALA